MGTEAFVEELRNKRGLTFVIACPIGDGRLSDEGMDRLEELGRFIDQVSGDRVIDAMASEDPACLEAVEFLAQGKTIFNWTPDEGDEEFNTPSGDDDAEISAQTFDEAIKCESSRRHNLLIMARPASINNWLNYRKQLRHLPAGSMVVYEPRNNIFYWPLG